MENPFLVDGQLRWTCRSGEESQIRIYEEHHLYEDVAVKAEIENFGANTNWMALMCRVNEDGWIEFRFTASGLYEIYRFDSGLHDRGQNPYIYITNGATEHMKAGKATNVVAMICQDSEFKFYANGNLIELKVPPQSRDEYARQGAGGVGIGFQVVSDNASPVDIGVEWFETFAP